MENKVLALTIFCYFNLALAKLQYQDGLKDFWENAKTGELLRSLDKITSTAQQTLTPIQKEKKLSKRTLNKPLFQRRIGDRTVESFMQQSPYDYDKSYDEFVKKYFGDSVTDALSASESSENIETQQDADSYSGEEQMSSEDNDDPVGEASKKTTQAEKCKKILRGQQHCLICENPRTGVNSESCSLKKETKPQSYEFEKQNNYRKYRTTPKSNKNEDSTEQDSSDEKYNASSEKPGKQIPNKSNDLSFCTVKHIKNKICYFCQNGKGVKVTKCYAEELPKKTDSKGQIKNEKKKLQESHQRIFKRTISYAYENMPHNIEKQQINQNYTVVVNKP